LKSGDVIFWKQNNNFSMGSDGEPKRYVVFDIRSKYATIEAEELYKQGLTFRKIIVPISELELVEEK